MDYNLNVTAQELADSDSEPTITVGRYVYRGRLLSIEEWLPFFEERIALELAAWAAIEEKRMPDMRPWVAHWVRYLKAVFPRSRFRFWAPDPVVAIRQEPGNALRSAYERFFFHQGHVLGMLPSARQTTDGTSSSGRTDAGPSDTVASGPEQN